MMALIGGRLIVEGGSAKGTTVRLVLPQSTLPFAPGA